MIHSLPFAYTHHEQFTGQSSTANTTAPPPSTNTTAPPPSTNTTAPPPSTNTTAPPTSASSQSAEPKQEGSLVVLILIGIFFLLWVVFGIAAFIMSLMCFGYSGTTVQHIIGLLLAIFFGPFYWIYFLVVKSYCGKKSSMYGGHQRTKR